MTTHRWDATGYDASFSFVTSYGAALLDLLAAAPGERVLDLGCGTGHQAAELAAVGVEVVGVDADPAMVDLARAEHPDVRFALADAQEPAALLAAADGPVDAVLSNAAMHWMPRQDELVAGIAGVLRPGGRLVAEMGGGANVARTTQAIRAGRGAVGLDPDIASSWTFPTPGRMATRLEHHGFDVALVQCFDRMTPLSEGDTTSSWARMFGASLVTDVPDALRAEFDRAVDARGAELGLAARPDGEPGWWADYVRLRMVAVRR
jgi:SAM-dependent methyltransferase